MSMLPWLAGLAPAGLLVVGLWPRGNGHPKRIAQAALLAAMAGLALSIVLAVAVAAFGRIATPTLGIVGGGLGFYLDALSVTMLTLVSFVGLIVLGYSRNYLDGDPRHGAFLQRLCLTNAAVQLLVVSGNLALLVVAWIATSLCLNRMLLFYPDRRAAVLAARKKFVVSRLGDGCLVGAACSLYLLSGGFDYATVFAHLADLETPSEPLIVLAALLIAAAAILKSAQFPLHGWLLEVMETPTPVSALLHAGIINAGGFLALRFAELLSMSTPALYVLAIAGGATALFGSLVMLTQTSIKVSLAYSTIAQMGFMLLQCGLGAYAAAVLHIIAHSLYKAHAFLSSGSVIDVLRASWSPAKGGSPHPLNLNLILALLVAIGITLGVGWCFGATSAEKPGVLALGAVLMMSLTLLIANAIDAKPNPFVIGRTLASALAVAALYFLLQTGSEHLFASAFPKSPSLGAADATLIATLVILAFAGVSVLQVRMGEIGSTPAGRALYVHLNHGLYVNTLANRLVMRFWPVRNPASRSS